MEYISIGIVILIMSSITILYFIIGYKFLKKHKRSEKKDGDN